jgi:2'-5' RNA ligase
VSETAVVVAVADAEPLVGRFRRRYTRDGPDGMPAHITLLYPFVDADRLGDGDVRRVADVLAAFEPLSVTFRETAFFRSPDDVVLWLRPEPSEPFVAMTEALVDAFPDYPPYGGIYDTIVPHLGIAHGDDELLGRIRAEVEPRLPLQTWVDEAWLFERAPKGWRRRRPFSLNRHRSD